MSNDRHKTGYIPYRNSQEKCEMIATLAAQKNMLTSEYLRRLVDLGLEADGGSIEENHLYETVYQAMQEVLKPSVERLASISAKATQIDAANFFMYIYALTRNGSEREQAEIQEAVEKARSLGIQYLKLRDRDLDSFIAGGAKQIADEN